jgi:hypothetical protein
MPEWCVTIIGAFGLVFGILLGFIFSVLKRKLKK